MKCSIVHCDGEVLAKGMCSKHYTAQRKYGDPLVVKQKQHHGLTAKERFFIYARPREGCWDWLGGKDANGYGRINVDARPILASRLSYLVHFGDIPKGMAVCHKCDNPGCVNPDHLFLGTQADNVRDMHEKGRALKRGMKGEEHHQAKIGVEQVRQIRKRTEVTALLAIEFGLSRTTIDDIRKRRTWAHVED